MTQLSISSRNKDRHSSLNEEPRRLIREQGTTVSIIFFLSFRRRETSGRRAFLLSPPPGGGLSSYTDVDIFFLIELVWFKSIKDENQISILEKTPFYACIESKMV